MDPAIFPQLIDDLDPDLIRAYLADLDRRARAARVLLRAALARSSARGSEPRPDTPEEVVDARC
jgi:hypothetical protein